MNMQIFLTNFHKNTSHSKSKAPLGSSVRKISSTANRSPASVAQAGEIPNPAEI